MVKYSSADRKLHAVTMTRRNKLALKFYLRTTIVVIVHVDEKSLENHLIAYMI